MVLMWVRFTTLHGPTSFNENGHWLGGSSIFWGGMIGFASLLIVLGLYGHRTLLVGLGGRSTQSGYWLTVIGLGATAERSMRSSAAAGLFLGGGATLHTLQS